MSEDVTIQINGLQELQAALDSLPAKIEQNVLRGALRAGAKLLYQVAYSLVPSHTGELRDTMRVSVSARNGLVTASVRVGPRSAKDWHGFYAKWVELGTSPHNIVAGPGKALPVYGGVHAVHHPGSRASPFLRPALDAHAEDAVIEARDYIYNRLSVQYGIDVPGPDNQTDPDES